VYEYIASGAGNEITLIDNERAYDRIRIWPRVLNDVRSVDTSVSLFGKMLSSPILLAPAAYQGAMHPSGELGTVEGLVGPVFPLSSAPIRRSRSRNLSTRRVRRFGSSSTRRMIAR
jgi:4-hydroxymandelate oxidase